MDRKSTKAHSVRASFLKWADQGPIRNDQLRSEKYIDDYRQNLKNV
jgi:hypothetical protein